MPSRREFLQVAGAGLLLPLLPSCLAPGRTAETAPVSLGPYLQLDSRGRATVWLTKAEMGQGVWTALPMILAEELEVDWGALRVRQADTAPEFGPQMTGGSASVSTLWDPLRTAGARAREMLIAAAAGYWGVAVSECRAERGRVVHQPSGRGREYGQLVAAAAGLPVPQAPRLKTPDEFRLVGRPIPRLEGTDKVTGRAVYGLDTRVPGMRVAVLARPPAFAGGEPDYDAEAAQRIPGVSAVVSVPSGVAVVAGDTWAALQGRRALACRFSGAPQLDSGEIARALRRRADRGRGAVARNEGDAPRALRHADRVVTADYRLPFLAHAPMEPMNCVADARPGRCEIWAPTQAPTGAASAVAEALGIPAFAVTIHTTLLGGGFGRRLLHDYAVEAALVSRAAGGPVQVVWTREDDFQTGWYRPTSLHRMRAGLKGGRLTGWSHFLASPSIDGTRAPTTEADEFNQFAVMGFANLPYRIPDLRVEYARVNTPVPVAWWRSVYSSQLVFANESFVDEVAAAAGADPLEFRLGMLAPNSRERRVLELAADRAGWYRARGPGRGLGVALHEFFGTVAAEVAEVEITGAAFRVTRIVCAVDCGLVVNPRLAAAQIEGGAIFGLSAALGEEVTIRNGQAVESNFGDYRVLRMAECPPVEVHFVPSESPPSGVGEPGTPPVAPAVANALVAAGGPRLRELPLALAPTDRELGSS